MPYHDEYDRCDCGAHDCEHYDGKERRQREARNRIRRKQEIRKRKDDGGNKGGEQAPAAPLFQFECLHRDEIELEDECGGRDSHERDADGSGESRSGEE